MQDYPKMIFVEGGSFMMGNENSKEEGDALPVHLVNLSSFYIAEVPTTLLQWKIFCLTTAQVKGEMFINQPETSPAVLINWFDAVAYCDWLTTILNKKYRLPTEAEWEFAARGGVYSKGCFYSGSNNINDVGWYKLNCNSRPQPVKQKHSNELGLYDMSGNIWEWCSDWYGEYTSEEKTNPNGSQEGDYRVMRGGSNDGPAEDCKVFTRLDGIDTLACTDSGFRVIMEL